MTLTALIKTYGYVVIFLGTFIEGETTLVLGVAFSLLVALTPIPLGTRGLFPFIFVFVVSIAVLVWIGIRVVRREHGEGESESFHGAPATD